NLSGPLLYLSQHPTSFPSSPTRRSSDLMPHGQPGIIAAGGSGSHHDRIRHSTQPVQVGQTIVSVDHLRGPRHRGDAAIQTLTHLDRKSTRLNSSHVKISYAVFCLNKKTL